MSHYLVELYTPKPAWLALPAAQREQFLHGIRSAMVELSSLGVEVLTLGEAEPDIDNASEHRFLGIWRFPGLQSRDALLAGIQASGWYGYFDHVNAAGARADLADHLSALTAA